MSPQYERCHPEACGGATVACGASFRRESACGDVRSRWWVYHEANGELFTVDLQRERSGVVRIGLMFRVPVREWPSSVLAIIAARFALTTHGATMPSEPFSVHLFPTHSAAIVPSRGVVRVRLWRLGMRTGDWGRDRRPMRRVAADEAAPTESRNGPASIPAVAQVLQDGLGCQRASHR